MAVKWVHLARQGQPGVGARSDAIRHEVKLFFMRFNHERMARRLSDNAGLTLPPHVKRDKLERAYYKISNDYVWVLKRRSREIPRAHA